MIGFATACGGGSGGGGGGAVSGPSGNFIGTFVADQPTPGANQVTAALFGSAGSTVTLDVLLTDTSNVFSASFDLLFDSTKIAYLPPETSGGALEQGGAAPVYAVDLVEPNRLAIGISRDGASGSTNVTNSQTLIRLTFQVIDAGTSTLSFANSQLLNGQNPPQPIAGTGWFGGEFQAN